jgi:hypothetical protein
MGSCLPLHWYSFDFFKEEDHFDVGVLSGNKIASSRSVNSIEEASSSTKTLVGSFFWMRLLLGQIE